MLSGKAVNIRGPLVGNKKSKKKLLQNIILNTWKSYMWTAVEETNMEAILAIMNTSEVVENKARKRIMDWTFPLNLM